MYRKGLQEINKTYDASQRTMHILHFQCYNLVILHG
jgi:hypothetical protein